jgi:hypothetical protein
MVEGLLSVLDVLVGHLTLHLKEASTAADMRGNAEKERIDNRKARTAGHP